LYRQLGARPPLTCRLMSRLKLHSTKDFRHQAALAGRIDD
jgi:hypothetical protein